MNTTDQTKPKSICVFSGASKMVDEHYYALARSCGQAIAKAGYRMVYGGGGVGLMGASAMAAFENGGQVLGIIPEFLTKVEALLDTVEHRIVKDMHERKQMMYQESDAYIVLPGGIGTMEEAIEVMSWMRLKLHTKPMVFVDTDNYWAPLIKLFNATIDAKFTPEWVRAHLFHCHSAKDALAQIKDQWQNPAPKGHIKVSKLDMV